jgi:hypothetical protein
MTVVKQVVSRPLRAFVVVITGWTAMRVAVLWQASAGIAAPLVEAKGREDIVTEARAVAVKVAARPKFDIAVPVTLVASRLLPERPQLRTSPQLSLARPTPSAPRAPSITDARAEPPSAPWLPSTDITSRFSGSVWALFRPDSSGAPLGTGGTLGGSQAGVRLFYDPGPHGLSLTGRLSAPLAMRLGREAAVGVGLRGRQVGVLLERRIALDHGARNAMSLTVYGGISDVALPHGLRMDGYVQFGLVGARSRDGFGDGALRVVRPLAKSGTFKLSVGGAVSGGAQPGVKRVDVGPELVGDILVAGRSVRLTVGWRERVAGNAAPGSGPSLGLGFGF